jgi:hypothetical protein
MLSCLSWSTTPTRIRPLFRLGLIGVLALQAAATGFLTFISANNYPGGEVWKALEVLHAKFAHHQHCTCLYRNRVPNIMQMRPEDSRRPLEC